MNDIGFVEWMTALRARAFIAVTNLAFLWLLNVMVFYYSFIRHPYGMSGRMNDLPMLWSKVNVVCNMWFVPCVIGGGMGAAGLFEVF